MPLAPAFMISDRTVADSRILLVASSLSLSASNGTTHKRLRNPSLINITPCGVGLAALGCISLGFVRFAAVGGLAFGPGTGGAAGPKQADTNCGFRNSLLLSDFLGGVALHLHFEQG